MNLSALTTAFLRVCDTGYQASIAVAVILAVRAALIRLKLPRKWICLLWSIPFLRLALPDFHPRCLLSLMPRQHCSPWEVRDI